MLFASWAQKTEAQSVIVDQLLELLADMVEGLSLIQTRPSYPHDLKPAGTALTPSGAASRPVRLDQAI